MSFMDHQKTGVTRTRCGAVFTCLMMLAVTLTACRSAPPTIAVIPRTSGTQIWEPEHGGALAAALPLGLRVYWNAPTREDDVQRQIELVEHASAGDFQGLILAPDQALALITPVRKALANNIPTVILGSPLTIPSHPKLGYVLNDEVAGGRMAAERVAMILHGHGTVAVLGIDPDISGIVSRVHIFEQFLADHYPDIHVVDNRLGSFNASHEQQIAEETFKAHPTVDSIVTMTSTSMHAALAAAESTRSTGVRIIAFDSDSIAFDAPHLDSCILENTRGMGAVAVRLIATSLRGQPMPDPVFFPPVLVTRQNARDPEVQKIVSMDWHPVSVRWKWSVGP
jgi:ribose transport system substrate-binding protein